jgi:acetyl esterase/lipase
VLACLPLLQRHCAAGIDPVLQWDRNHYGSALAYVGGNASKLTDPLVSPLRADWSSSIFTKARFPAVLIQVGLRDSLLSASTMLYRKLTAAGFPCVKFSPWEGMWHVFQVRLAWHGCGMAVDMQHSYAAAVNGKAGT